MLSSLESNLKPGINKISSKNGTYRVENTPIGIFSVKINDDIGPVENYTDYFILKLPKIPISLIQSIISEFKAIYYRNHTEWAAQIFWNIKDQFYYSYYPQQHVTAYSVYYERDFNREANDLLVMDIHSHHIMSPVFSAVDNRDELGTRLYAVVGNINLPIPKINVRAGVGGHYIKIKSKDVFI